MAVPVTFNIQPPDLAPIRLVAPSDVSGPPNPSVLIAWGVTNRVTGGLPLNAPYWIDCLYLSTDTNLDWPGTMLTCSRIRPARRRRELLAHESLDSADVSKRDLLSGVQDRRSG